MEINLNRPLCFFDLETTGVNIVKDRIVEISIIKILPNNQEESKTWLINPEIKIPKVVSAIHGITDEMVKDKPNFKEFSTEIYEFIKGCDLAGFNSNKFDIPLLAEELLRSEIDFDLSKIKTIDVQNIFHKMEKRTLSAAYKFYCGKAHEDAHSSMSDTRVTYEVFLAQLEKYKELENNIDFLSNFSTMRKSIDLAGFIYESENKKAVFSFGKYKNQEIDYVIENDPGYFSWILKSDFPNYTKKILNQLRLNKLNNKLK
jgi:DNA polymerase-3 subunit epsilon